MKKLPLISIITPVYNTAPLLPRCINSVLKQTYPNWELLLVNDGSTDNSLEICRGYATQDQRIRVFSQANQGQSVARNVALKEAKGDLIAFLDSDDALKSDTYEGIVDTFLCREDVDVVVMPVQWSNSTQIFWTYQNKPQLLFGLQARQALAREQFGYFVWNKVYRRSILSKIQFLPGILFEDNLYLFEVIRFVQGVATTDIGGYEYHQEEYSANKNQWTEKKERDILMVYSKILKLYQGHDVFDREVRLRTYQRIVNYTYPRIMRWRVEDRLQEQQWELSQISLMDIWLKKNHLKLHDRVKLSISKIWSRIYLLKHASNRDE